MALGDETIRTRFIAEGTAKGAADVQRYNSAIRGTSEESDRANEATTELFRMEGRLGQALAKLGPEAVAAGAAIGGIALAATAATTAVAGVVAVMMRLGQAGSEAEQAGRAFDRVAGPDTARRLREATDGLVRATTAQEAYGRAARSGLGNAELLRYFEYTATAAREMGRDVSEAVTSAGAAIENMTRDEALARLDQLENEFGGVESATRNAAEAFALVEVNARDAFDRFAEGFATNESLIRQLSAIGVATDQGGVSWEAYGDAVASATARLGAAARAFLTMAGTSPVAGLVAAFDVLARGGGGAPAPPPPPPPGEGGGAYDLPEIVVSGSPRRGGGGRGGGGRGGEYRTQVVGSLGEAIAAEGLSKIEDATTAVNRALEDQVRIQQELMAIRQAQFAVATEQAQAELDATERQLEADERMATARAARLDRSMSLMQQYVGAADTLGASLAGVFGELAAQEEAGSEGAKKWAKAQGSVLAAFSFVKSAVEFALAIASGASQDYGAMAGHLAAGAALAAAGAMAVSDLGGSAKASSEPATPTGRFSAARERDEQEQTGGGGDVTIWTLGYGDAGLGRALEGASRRYARSGLDPQMAGAGGWG